MTGKFYVDMYMTPLILICGPEQNAKSGACGTNQLTCIYLKSMFVPTIDSTFMKKSHNVDITHHAGSNAIMQFAQLASMVVE